MQTQPGERATSASALIKAFDILEELNILLVGIQHIGPYILHVTGLNTVVTGSDPIGHHLTKTSKGFRALLRLSLRKRDVLSYTICISFAVLAVGCL